MSETFELHYYNQPASDKRKGPDISSQLKPSGQDWWTTSATFKQTTQWLKICKASTSLDFDCQLPSPVSRSPYKYKKSTLNCKRVLYRVIQKSSQNPIAAIVRTSAIESSKGSMLVTLLTTPRYEANHPSLWRKTYRLIILVVVDYSCV